jgi:Arc/MetJ-type ribon-helix-helix transcriptional regulator
MAQLVTRIDEELADQIDELVRQGVATSRSEVVRMGLVQLIDRYRREQVGRAIAEAYRREPQSVEEAAGLDVVTRALVEEEPW